MKFFSRKRRGDFEGAIVDQLAALRTRIDALEQDQRRDAMSFESLRRQIDAVDRGIGNVKVSLHSSGRGDASIGQGITAANRMLEPISEVEAMQKQVNNLWETVALIMQHLKIYVSQTPHIVKMPAPDRPARSRRK